MSILDQIAFYQNRRDEVPNQELARRLAASDDVAGIEEIAGHLFDKNSNVSSDCLKVLYETGYLKPGLIAPYADDFLKLLGSKQNRMVWGAMIALSTIAGMCSQKLYEKRAVILKAMNQGSVITMDAGVKVLAVVAAQNPEGQTELFPYLLEHLKTCRLKEVPQHAESIFVCVNDSNKNDFMAVLQERLPDMIPSQAARIKRIIKKLA